MQITFTYHQEIIQWQSELFLYLTVFAFTLENRWKTGITKIQIPNLINLSFYFQQLKTAMLSVNEANSTVNKVVKMASDYIEPAEVSSFAFDVDNDILKKYFRCSV